MKKLESFRLAQAHSGLARSHALLLAISATAVVVLVYLWLSGRDAAGPTVAPPPSTSKQAVPEQAREVISEQQQEEQPDFDQALQQARQLRAEGKLADAQLLYFYAARGGHGEAAFELAELYDPNHFDPSSSLMDEADAFQAFKWYQVAAQANIAEATSRLDALKTWAESEAEAGNLDAEHLLLQWD